jgi:hypothetical protein
MSKHDISLEEIYKLLKAKESKINNITEISTKNIKKLKIIDQKIENQKMELLQLLVTITDSEQDVSMMDSKQVLNKKNELTNKINKVLTNLRNIRNSLAEIIR